MKISETLNPSVVLAPFQDAMGIAFEKIVNDGKAMLGRLDTDIVSKGGHWKAGAKGTLTNKEGHTLQLPLNDPMSCLFRFGLEIQDLERRADFGGVYSKNESITPVFAIPHFAEKYVSEEIAKLKAKASEVKASVAKITA